MNMIKGGKCLKKFIHWLPVTVIAMVYQLGVESGDGFTI